MLEEIDWVTCEEIYQKEPGNSNNVGELCISDPYVILG